MDTAEREEVAKVAAWAEAMAAAGTAGATAEEATAGSFCTVRDSSARLHGALAPACTIDTR